MAKKTSTVYTLEKANKAIDALAEGKGAAGAARIIGVSRKTLYNWRDKYPKFAEQWDEAQETITDRLESTAIERGLSGDTTMLIFMLKSRRRSVYQDKVEHTGENGSPLTILISEREDGPK